MSRLLRFQTADPGGLAARLCRITRTLQQEIDKSKWITFTPHSGPASVSHRTGVVDFFGKDFLVGADGYTGTSGSDPTNQVYFHIMTGLQHNNYSVGPVQVRANVTITYDVVWTEPKPLPAS